MDASLPIKSAANKFVCTVKVVDHTYHSRGTERRANSSAGPAFKFVNCIFYGRRPEDCPAVASVGDIIRIHRATPKEHNGSKQLHVNVQFNSSWVLFALNAQQQGSTVKSTREDRLGADEEDEPGADERSDSLMRPYKFSGKNYSFDPMFERPGIANLRTWAGDYLAQNSVVHLSSFTPLREIDESS